jgi:hypothetical protein
MKIYSNFSNFFERTQISVRVRCSFEFEFVGTLKTALTIFKGIIHFRSTIGTLEEGYVDASLASCVSRHLPSVGAFYFNLGSGAVS